MSALAFAGQPGGSGVMPVQPGITSNVRSSSIVQRNPVVIALPSGVFTLIVSALASKASRLPIALASAPIQRIVRFHPPRF